MVHVCPRSHQTNLRPFPVQNYVREVERYSETQRFAAVMAGPHGEVELRMKMVRGNGIVKPYVKIDVHMSR